MYNIEVGGQFTNAVMGYAIVCGVVMLIFIAAVIIARFMHPSAKWDGRVRGIDPTKWRRPDGWRL